MPGLYYLLPSTEITLESQYKMMVYPSYNSSLLSPITLKLNYSRELKRKWERQYYQEESMASKNG